LSGAGIDRLSHAQAEACALRIGERVTHC